MPRLTEPVRELVAEALERVPDRASPDVTDEVCLVIERDPALLRRYRALEARLSHDVVNNFIGSYTRELVEGTRLKTRPARSGRLKSYSQLGH
jgi:hypothetical protein